MMENKNRINSPEGVKLLIENLWLRHKSRISLPKNNVFMVELPPLTEEEKAAINAEKEAKLRAAKELDDKPEDLYGAWI